MISSPKYAGAPLNRFNFNKQINAVLKKAGGPKGGYVTSQEAFKVNHLEKRDRPETDHRQKVVIDRFLLDGYSGDVFL